MLNGKKSLYLTFRILSTNSLSRHERVLHLEDQQSTVPQFILKMLQIPHFRSQLLQKFSLNIHLRPNTHLLFNELKLVQNPLD